MYSLTRLFILAHPSERILRHDVSSLRLESNLSRRSLYTGEYDQGKLDDNVEVDEDKLLNEYEGLDEGGYPDEYGDEAASVEVYTALYLKRSGRASLWKYERGPSPEVLFKNPWDDQEAMDRYKSLSGNHHRHRPEAELVETHVFPTVLEIAEQPTSDQVGNLLSTQPRHKTTYSFHAYCGHGTDDDKMTVEFRAAAGSLDAGRVVAWARFCAQTLTFCRETKPKPFIHLLYELEKCFLGRPSSINDVDSFSLFIGGPLGLALGT